MTCDAVRSAMTATAAGEWTSEMRAHVAGCEACASEAVERALPCPPAVDVPPTFAADVARRARLAAPVVTRRAVAPLVGLAAAAVVIVLCAAWMAISDDPATSAPIAAMLLAGGEAIVFAAASIRSAAGTGGTPR
jgi:hypothetical protein